MDQKVAISPSFQNSAGVAGITEENGLWDERERERERKSNKDPTQRREGENDGKKDEPKSGESGRGSRVVVGGVHKEQSVASSHLFLRGPLYADVIDSDGCSITDDLSIFDQATQRRSSDAPLCCEPSVNLWLRGIICSRTKYKCIGEKGGATLPRQDDNV